jgi:hypothetical protein
VDRGRALPRPARAHHRRPQVTIGGAGRADLIGIDPAGRWVVIEIKAGALYRETVAQGLDYAAALATLDDDTLRQIVHNYASARGVDPPSELQLDQPREVIVIVVGTESDAGLARVAEYLSGFGVPIRAVAFQTFEIDGEPLLIREITETTDTSRAKHSAYDVKSVLELAAQAGRGPAMQTVLDAANRCGLFPAPNKTCIRFAPPENRTRCLLTVWTGDWYCEPEAFNQFYDLPVEKVVATLGEAGWHKFNDEAARRIASGLDTLFAASE